MQGGGYDQGFHEIRMKSAGFHVKYGGFHVKSKDLLQGIVTLCLLFFAYFSENHQYLEMKDLF